MGEDLGNQKEKKDTDCWGVCVCACPHPCVWVACMCVCMLRAKGKVRCSSDHPPFSFQDCLSLVWSSLSTLGWLPGIPGDSPASASPMLGLQICTNHCGTGHAYLWGSRASCSSLQRQDGMEEELWLTSLLSWTFELSLPSFPIGANKPNT